MVEKIINDFYFSGKGNFLEILKLWQDYAIEKSKNFTYKNINLLNWINYQEKLKEYGYPTIKKEFKNIEELFFIPVNILKKFSFLIDDKKNIALTLGSSGTSGTRTINHWNQFSLDRLNFVVQEVAKMVNIKSNTKTYYAIFGYNPKDFDDLGTAWSDENMKMLAPEIESFYCLNKDNSINWEIIDFLIEANKKAPIRFLGFPFLMWEIASKLKEKNIKLKINPENLIITGGGWKKREKEKVTRTDFINFVSNTFGVLPENTRDVFGMTEHGLPYFACSHGNFHIHRFAKVITRDPITLKPTKNVGLLQFISFYNTTTISASVLSSDYGIIQSNCPCGLKEDYFIVLGRAGKVKLKGCAIKAEESVSL